MQNGFRPGRRLEDNLFALAECVSIAKAEQRPLLCCFLDVEKAYDNVPHAALFESLSTMNLPAPLLTTVQRLYKDSTAIAHFGSAQSSPVKLKYSTVGVDERCRLPGLAFADDLVLMAESAQDLQDLIQSPRRKSRALGSASIVKNLQESPSLAHWAKQARERVREEEEARWTHHGHLDRGAPRAPIQAGGDDGRRSVDRAAVAATKGHLECWRAAVAARHS
ncbi:hypothetical protein HPB52_014174 [Rhipicephalus sanguineus]|uniref:Reverse transcriptase domain-containing protein n=1 Tax=Rhipicephalus sanguineus TaxID=34632 RepID=A0A9D4Q9D9_RHISA|nr:hypothetical protein HPB52_014174 [Rhipicephalus sanguineus]